MSYALSGLDDKVAVVSGAGRMRSIGRPIAVALAQAGCDVVLTGTGRSKDRYPDDEKAAGWRDIESVAHEVRALRRRALPLVFEVGAAGVRVNTICPGLIDTSRMDDMGRGEGWDDVIKQMVPLGRAGSGEDIAHIVVYLCSDEGSWVTGQAWNVDGGTVVQH